MSNYKHGVYVNEVTTSLQTPVNAENALPVIVGTAPIHNMAEEARLVNKPRIIYNMLQFTALFGDLSETDNSEDFTLWQAANIYLSRYKVAPIICINVFDPSKHKKTSTDDNGVSLETADVSLVTEEDIIGKEANGKRTGLFLCEEIFTLFRLVPGLILAPKYAADPTVALAIGAACKNICGHFKCLGIYEVPNTVTSYQDVPAWIKDNNLIDPNLMCVFGSGYYAEKVEPGSLHLAACIGGRDGENDNIPYYSPSNFKMQIESWYHAGEKCVLAPPDANFLNGNGVVTALNFVDGFVAWGDQTTAYPSNTDVKDNSIPIRRMFSWLSNTLVLNSWKYVSGPIRRRLIETVQDTYNVWLNALVAKEYILDGRVEFEYIDNPTSDLMAGKVVWHVYFTPPQAAREIGFDIEYDPSALETLFANMS